VQPLQLAFIAGLLLCLVLHLLLLTNACIRSKNNHHTVDAMADTWPLQELIGHCTALYHANRTAALQLEQHLCQYGYQRPAGAVLEPENPDDFILQEDQQQFGAFTTCQHYFAQLAVSMSLPAKTCVALPHWSQTSSPGAVSSSRHAVSNTMWLRSCALKKG
jgi:hypothetical protein